MGWQLSGRKCHVSRGVYFDILPSVSVTNFMNVLPLAVFMRIWLDNDPDNTVWFTGFAILGATSFLCSMAMLT